MLTVDLLKKIIESAKSGNVYSIKPRWGSIHDKHVIKIAEELKLIKITETMSVHGQGIQVVTLTDEYKKLLCGP